MAEDQDESQKTEEPSAKKLREAKEKGQIAQSREVNNLLMIFGMALVVMMVAPYAAQGLMDMMANFIERSNDFSIDTIGSYQGFLMGAVWGTLKTVGIAFFILIVLAFLTGFVQNGLIWSGESLKPKLERISPLKGFKRLFSMKSIVEFVKGLTKITVVGVVGFILLEPILEHTHTYITQSPSASAQDMHAWAVKLLIGVMVVVAMIAALDFLYQKFEFLKSMRMTKQELKDEFKQTEGDPQIKSKIRQLRQERARKRMMAAVPTADVVITNPTHYAVALKYDFDTMAAPLCVAKGLDTIALNIRKIAEENKVSIIENPPLARALYDSVDLDETIPEEHFKAVAEIIAFVFRQKGKMPQRPSS